jgi:hypothetical protein
MYLYVPQRCGKPQSFPASSGTRRQLRRHIDSLFRNVSGRTEVTGHLSRLIVSSGRVLGVCFHRGERESLDLTGSQRWDKLDRLPQNESLMA